jgi:uncharacterized protein (DUF1330 family)
VAACIVTLSGLGAASEQQLTGVVSGGRFIVKGGSVEEVLEGNLHPHTVTILEFPTLDRAQAWYRSPEYRNIIHHRHEAGSNQVILFQGS